MAKLNWRGGLAEAGETLQALGISYAKMNWDLASKRNLLGLQAELLEARDRALADVERETYRQKKSTDLDAAGKAGDMEVDIARRKPRSLAPGHSEIVNGEVTITAPDVSRPQELLDYYRAQAGRLNAESDAIRSGLKYKPRADKPAVPSIKVERGSDGEIYNLDTASGAVGRLIAAEPGRKGETRWFGPNDPDTPSQPARIEWSVGGRVLPGGLSDLYPALRERAGVQPSSGDIAGLKARASNPQAVAAFETQFGPGSASKYLNQPGIVDPFRSGGKPASDNSDKHVYEGMLVQGAKGLKNFVSDVFSENLGEARGDGREVELPQLQVNTAPQLSMREQHFASRAEMQGRRDQFAQARREKTIRDGFRVMLQTGRYWPEDRPAIETALQSGVLTEPEQSIARKMLSEIEGNSEFNSGFKRGRGVPAGFAR